ALALPPVPTRAALLTMAVRHRPPRVAAAPPPTMLGPDAGRWGGSGDRGARTSTGRAAIASPRPRGLGWRRTPPRVGVGLGRGARWRTGRTTTADTSPTTTRATMATTPRRSVGGSGSAWS